MDPQPLPAARAERHRLPGDARLAIVEALEEGPRQVPELARILGLHPTTVRAHLERLLQAGVLEMEPGRPTGRGRPSMRYRLRQPLLVGDPEVSLFVTALVSLLRDAYGSEAPSAAEREGTSRGRQMARSLRRPSMEQTVNEVIRTLKRLSFHPGAPIRRGDTVAVELHRCPFHVDPSSADARAIVCGFHRGLVRGLAETAYGQPVEVALLPFVAPDRCRIELCFGRTRPDRDDRGRASGPSVALI